MSLELRTHFVDLTDDPEPIAAPHEHRIVEAADKVQHGPFRDPVLSHKYATCKSAKYQSVSPTQMVGYEEGFAGGRLTNDFDTDSAQAGGAGHESSRPRRMSANFSPKQMKGYASRCEHQNSQAAKTDVDTARRIGQQRFGKR